MNALYLQFPLRKFPPLETPQPHIPWMGGGDDTDMGVGVKSSEKVNSQTCCPTISNIYIFAQFSEASHFSYSIMEQGWRRAMCCE